MTRKKWSYLALALVGLFVIIFLFWDNIQAVEPLVEEPAVLTTDDPINQPTEEVIEENEDSMIGDGYARILQGTVVEITEDEVLFVARLNLSKEELERSFDDWLTSAQSNDVYRLAGIGDDVTVGTEIQISFAITTMSIPPLAPVIDYQILD